MQPKRLDFFSPYLEWPYPRAIRTITADENAKKQEPLYTVGGNAH
jgi:hypothetical protein